MSAPTESYLKVHYELRPAKQVERRMLVDSLLALALAGFSIRDYQYTGMGSIYFIDFVLFHRLLGIRKMLSVEYNSSIRKRIDFNRPFDCVQTKIAPIGDVIPTLSRDLKHLVWLDYDGVLLDSHLQDVSLAATYLSVGSILLVTVDIEPPPNTDTPKQWRDYFTEQARDYLDPALGLRDFAKSALPLRNIELIHKAIMAGMAGRTGVEFLPMFNFIYKDGHQMLTIGGMFGTPTEKRKIQGSFLAETDYYRDNFKANPCVISVPRLTRKERHYLDRFMPCPEAWTPPDFELSADSVTAYRDIYRFCPTYAELSI